ncbi:CCA tRNA nucleotidyltransferase [Metabacillus sp. 84]|uniref:CCA tRNA nucleotidyltransferase n=1 Tax=Metabacillus sp. 84 TaxID=3404705 RepID=UPI003CF35BDD
MKSEFLRALPVIEELEKNGYEAYFVGGSVRDLLLGREIRDVDIATSAPPEEIERIFPKTADVGAAHGTILVLMEGEPFEVTTFRTESAYENFRRPENVQFVTSLTEDLKRRDFTINAIAMDKNGNLYDYFHGREALSLKLIQTVGSPEERFSEDALRMLRALRFSSQLQFSLSEDTLEAICKLSGLLKHISVERKLSEFDKLLSGKSAVPALHLLRDTGLIDYMPGLAMPSNRMDQFLARTLPASFGTAQRWALLLFDLHPEEPEKFLKQWKKPGKTMKEILNILFFLNERLKKSWNEELLYKADEKTVFYTESICSSQPDWKSSIGPEEAVRRYRDLNIHSRNDLRINGDDLVCLAKKDPGPWIASALTKIEEEVLAGRLANSAKDIERWFLQWSNRAEM